MDISIVIRTYNEEQNIGELLELIFQQKSKRAFEVIVVDSESTDRTLEIVQKFPVNLLKIPKRDFTFGYSLNHGIRAAKGRFIAITSGHCVPLTDRWLDLMVEPLERPEIAAVSGRQVGTDTMRNGHPSTRFSERKIFEKHYPLHSIFACEKPFLNNANAAIRRDVWEKIPFDESLTGLEDLDFAFKAAEVGLKTSYVAEAVVLHLHDENNARVFNRFFREEIALRKCRGDGYQRRRTSIAFELMRDLFGDLADASVSDGGLKRYLITIVGYRLAQYFGIYLAHHGKRSAWISLDRVHDFFLRKITKGLYDLRALRMNKEFAKCWH